MTAPLFSKTRMQYETPREGITIGGYVARRLHKTALLKPVPDFLKHESACARANRALRRRRVHEFRSSDVSARWRPGRRSHRNARSRDGRARHGDLRR